MVLFHSGVVVNAVLAPGFGYDLATVLWRAGERAHVSSACLSCVRARCV